MSIFDGLEIKAASKPNPPSRLIVQVHDGLAVVLYACGTIEHEHHDGGVPGFGPGYVQAVPNGVYVAEGEPKFYNARGFEDVYDEWCLDKYEPTLRPITSDEWKRYVDSTVNHEAVWDDEWNEALPEEKKP